LRRPICGRRPRLVAQQFPQGKANPAPSQRPHGWEAPTCLTPRGRRARSGIPLRSRTLCAASDSWAEWNEWGGRGEGGRHGREEDIEYMQGGKGDEAGEGTDANPLAQEAHDEARLSSLAKELSATFPSSLRRCSSDRDFDLTQWKGAAVLNLEIRRFVSELPDLGSAQDAHRLAHVAVHSANLAQLHQMLNLAIHRDGGRKARADHVEALMWELSENSSRNVLRMILSELAIIAQVKMTNGTKQSFAAMVNWVRSFEVPKGIDFTHSSFRGECDWCTQSVRLAITTHCLDRLYRRRGRFMRVPVPHGVSPLRLVKA